MKSVTLKNSGHYYTLARHGTTRNAIQVIGVPDGVASSEVLRRANQTIVAPGVTEIDYGKLGVGRVVTN